MQNMKCGQEFVNQKLVYDMQTLTQYILSCLVIDLELCVVVNYENGKHGSQ